MNDQNVLEILRLKDEKIEMLRREITELKGQIDELEELLAQSKVDFD